MRHYDASLRQRFHLSHCADFRDHLLLFAEQDGRRAAAQIKAFDDTWRWDQVAARAYEEVVEAGGEVSRAMQAFRTLLAESDMLAYLAMMAPRLVELKRVMKPTASIYLHCDPTASHYLKLLLDSVFGPTNFQNEIIWRYRRWTGASRRFLRMHDVILFYTKTEKQVFNRLYTPYTDKSLARKQSYHTRIKGDDVYVTSINPKGVAENDVWDIQLLNSQAKERLGYPTQKPEALLERIIRASSNEGDVVLDPFCGCGTTVAVAHRLDRHWIGIDITHLAVNLIKTRLQGQYGDGVTKTYEVIGEPTSLQDAATLATEDPWQFQAWALGLVGARPAGPTKKGADRGIDGRLYFHDAVSGPTKQIIFSVKAGQNISVQFVRDLRGVIERETAEIGVLLSFAEPTRPMRTEAAAAGFYDSPWGKHPRLQLLTVAELLAGARIDYPPSAQTNATFKKAQRADREQAQTLPLLLDDDESANQVP